MPNLPDLSMGWVKMISTKLAVQLSGAFIIHDIVFLDVLNQILGTSKALFLSFVVAFVKMIVEL